MTTARQWLVAALEEYGAGAKTALGYGQFHVRPEHPLLERMEKERRRRQEMATPEGRWRLKLDGYNEDQYLGEVRANIVNSGLEDREERRAFIRVIVGTGMVSSWKKGRPVSPDTKTGAKKLKEAARAVLRAAEELGVDIPQ